MSRTSRLIILLVSIFFISCCGKRGVRKRLDLMIGSKVSLTQLSYAFFNGKDTTILNSDQAIVRMIVLFDSTYCASCHLPQFQEWYFTIAYSKATQSRFEPVFIFCPGQNEKITLKRYLTSTSVDWPLFVDEKSGFLEQNTFIPRDNRYHTFLIDKEDRIILVGNPLRNKKMWELYKEQINIHLKMN